MGYNPNIPHLFVGSNPNPSILTINPNFQRDSLKSHGRHFQSNGRPS